MSDEPEKDVGEVSAAQILEIADSMPQTVLAAVKANLKNENAQRIRLGEPLIPDITPNEERSLQYGARVAVDLMVRALHDIAVPTEERT